MVSIAAQDKVLSNRIQSMDWDGRIRMDPSSPYAMHRLIGMKDRFDLSFACDTDHDRHGIVTRNAGLLPPNHSFVSDTLAASPRQAGISSVPKLIR
jgi:phosphoglucomutase